MQKTSLKMNAPFILLLSSMGLTTFGDTLRAIAVIFLLHRLTGSGLATSLALVFSLMPGFFISPFAGSLGDFFSEKHLLVLTELLRSAVITLFLSADTAPAIYTLLAVLAALDALGSPSFKRLIVSLMGKEGVMKANSCILGVAGATNILGSALSGICAAGLGFRAIFLFNSIIHIAGAVLILLIKLDKTRNPSAGRKNPQTHPFSINLRLVPALARDTGALKKIIETSAVLSFVSISTTIAFYPYAFDILKVTDTGWSVILTLFSISNIIAMLVSVAFKKKMKDPAISTVFLLLTGLSAVWFSYGMLKNLLPVLVLQLAEGTLLSLISIILITRLQITANKDYIARAAGINDFIGTVAKLAGTGYAYTIIGIFSVKHLFLINSTLILAYSLSRLISSLSSKAAFPKKGLY